jgi:hypothetical protein
MGHKQRKCAARGFLRSLPCAPNWLAAESVSPLPGCRLAQPRECKLNANAESRISADSQAISERGADIECDLLPSTGHLPR